MKHLKLLTVLASSFILFSCRGPGDPPSVPFPILKQTLIDQKICDEKGNCEIVSQCNYYQFIDGAWIKTGSGPIKNKENPGLSCHGSFGLSAQEVRNLMEYDRQMREYIEKLKRFPR